MKKKNRQKSLKDNEQFLEKLMNDVFKSVGLKLCFGNPHVKEKLLGISVHPENEHKEKWFLKDVVSGDMAMGLFTSHKMKNDCDLYGFLSNGFYSFFACNDLKNLFKCCLEDVEEFKVLGHVNEEIENPCFGKSFEEVCIVRDLMNEMK